MIAALRPPAPVIATGPGGPVKRPPPFAFIVK